MTNLWQYCCCGSITQFCVAAQWRFAESTIPIICCFVLPVVLGSTASYMHYSNPSWRERRGHAPASKPRTSSCMASLCQRLHAIGMAYYSILSSAVLQASGLPIRHGPCRALKSERCGVGVLFKAGLALCEQQAHYQERWSSGGMHAKNPATCLMGKAGPKQLSEQHWLNLTLCAET
jgi:hypothetical protein